MCKTQQGVGKFYVARLSCTPLRRNYDKYHGELNVSRNNINFMRFNIDYQSLLVTYIVYDTGDNWDNLIVQIFCCGGGSFWISSMGRTKDNDVGEAAWC